MDRPYAPSCDRNKEPILEVLQAVLPTTSRNLLEIGAGTGQHAVFLAPNFPHLQWLVSDRVEHHDGITMWLETSEAGNIVGPIALEIGCDDWPDQPIDLVFTANTLHIMPWEIGLRLFAELGTNLKSDTRVIFYGPFNREGEFTSEGNRTLDAFIKQANPLSGIRDFEQVIAAMAKEGFTLLNEHAMPSNNLILEFSKDEARPA